MLYQKITSDSINNYNNSLSLTTQNQSSHKLHLQDDILLIFVKSIFRLFKFSWKIIKTI